MKRYNNKLMEERRNIDRGQERRNIDRGQEREVAKSKNGMMELYYNYQDLYITYQRSIK